LNPVAIDLLLAAPPFVLGLAPTHRLIWPRWKVGGKALFYFGMVAGLSFLIGRWSVVLGWAHQLSGLAFHVWFCRKHGFTWYAVEDPARYVALSKAAVGVVEPMSGVEEEDRGSRRPGR